MDLILKKELRQLYEEGLDVHPDDATVYLETTPVHDLEMVIRQLRQAKKRADFRDHEPEDLETILAGYADVLVETKQPGADAFHGAVLGRMIGCTLGKPLELGPFFWESTASTPGWHNVKRWFEGAGCYPIRDYVPSFSSAKAAFGLSVGCPKSQKEHLRYVETDDDVRYTLVALELLERRGFAFTDRDLGRLWHELLPYGDVCTAETQAYLNFALMSSHLSGATGPLPAEAADYVRRHDNPYREWIGAQIRIDGYAYAAAGNPRLAATLASRDAHFSHVKNGVYAAMFFAAMIASAFVTDDIDACVEQAFHVIPTTSRLYRYLRRTEAIARRHTDAEAMIAEVWGFLLDFDPAHAINNACICLAAILFARGDFSTAIGTAVLFGLDTDCNGATTGSFMGALVGKSRIPEHWQTPLHDTIHAGIRGFEPIAISAVAERFRRLHERLR